MDVIDALAGIDAGSRLDELRAHRPEARLNAQATYDALFSPVDDSAMPLVERWAVAAFATSLFGVPEAEEHYRSRLAEANQDVAVAVSQAVQAGRAEGPYGSYDGELAGESVPGPELELDSGLREALGERLAVALEHTHMLVLHPRDSSRERLEPLVDAGWTADGIVTLSQLVSFLAFQVRVVAGLVVLGAEGGR
ncbi:MAG TPA: CMD domain protein [Propionibacteriaceae bacterium]|nr:CMD domain protein [Propionibacteriaceae bacterium]